MKKLLKGEDKNDEKVQSARLMLKITTTRMAKAGLEHEANLATTNGDAYSDLDLETVKAVLDAEADNDHELALRVETEQPR